MSQEQDQQYEESIMVQRDEDGRTYHCFPCAVYWYFHICNSS